MRAYSITVLEPGAKRRKLYGGNGRIVVNVIHAVQYTQPREEVEAFAAELTRDNPGFDFAVMELRGGRNMYATA